VEGGKASGDQVVQRAKRIRALIGIAGAGDGLQLYGFAEPPRGGALIDGDGSNRRHRDLLR
jgi:hypothetical protein